MLSENDDLYDILKIKPSASREQIRRAFRSLALKFHPDKNLNNIEYSVQEFYKISKAYSILSDQQKKERYDTQMMLQQIRMRQKQCSLSTLFVRRVLENLDKNFCDQDELVKIHKKKIRKNA